MTKVRTLTRSFAGGELAPELQGRVDLEKYQSGLARCENFIPLPHGPALARPGFRYVIEVKDSTKAVRLIPFTFSTDETQIIEMGPGYFRFHTNGETVLDPQKTVGSIAGATVTIASHGYTVGSWVYMGGRYYRVTSVPNVNQFVVANLDGSTAAPSGTVAARVYEISHFYTEDELFDIHYVQSNDVVTLVHPSHQPNTLRRTLFGWILAAVSFDPLLLPPTGVAISRLMDPDTSSNRPVYTYGVTALNETGIEESEISSLVSITNNLAEFSNTNTITWDAVTGATRYNAYRIKSGIPYYIGQTASLSFTDDNIVPDTGKSAPEYSNPFDAPTKYPSAVSYFDQRKVFAATLLAPQSVFMTRPGTESNFAASYPTIDNDPIIFEIASMNQNRIRHLIPLADLVALTSGGEYRIYNGSGEPVTPSTVMARPQSYNGANNVQPVVTAASALYVQAKGSRIRELTYDSQGSGGYNSEDVSVLAPHLFNGFEMLDMAFSRGPVPLVWVVRDDGTLLGMTYEPTQQVRAWHRQTTDGEFESVACVSEGNEDVLYVVVKRLVNARVVRYIERLDSPIFVASTSPSGRPVATECFRVDAGSTYRGAPATTISGLWHLEGRTVRVLGDGAVMPPKVVTNGAITLEQPVSIAHIGLPIICTLDTLPAVLEESAAGQGLMKNVTKVYLRVVSSSGVFVGPDAEHLREFKQRTTEPYGEPPAVVTGIIEVPLTAEWGRNGTITIVQSDPLPLELLSATLEVAVGG